MAIKINGQVQLTTLLLDSSSEVELLLSHECASSFGFDLSDRTKFTPCQLSHGTTTVAYFEYQGIIEVLLRTARCGIRSTKSANVLVGGSINKMGLPTMTRLRIAVRGSSGIITIFPNRPPKV